MGGAVAFAILVLYLATSARDLVFGDSPELTGAAVTLGVAHPPGYPVWTVLAHLFTLVPVDTLSFRVSAFSALDGAACVVMVYATAYRLSPSVLAAAVAAAMLGLTPVFWSWSIVPEVFALHAALAAALLALLHLWHTNQRPRHLIAAAFVGGLGIANQQTIVLLGPAVLYLVWHHRRLLLGGGVLWKAPVALVCGLLPYAYLPLAAARRPAWNYGDIASVGDLFAQIFRTDLGAGQLVSDRSFQGGSAVDRLALFAQSFDVASAALILVGAFALYRHDRVLFWFTVVAAAVAGPAFVVYANVDLRTPVLRTVLERFFVLSHVVVAPLVALGIVSLGAWSWRRAEAWLSAAAAAAALLVALGVAAVNLARIDQHDNHDARHFAEDILATTPQDKILLAGGDASIWPIGYLRTIEGARPDLTFVQIPLLTFNWYVRQIGREYPDLVLRAPRYDGQAGTSRDLVEPNGANRFEIAGGLLDDSLSTTDVFFRRGLLQELRPKGTTIDVGALAADSDRYLRTYRIPSTAAVAGRNWDQLILGDYAFIAYDVAQAYESRGATAQARTWYTRALGIDPDLVEAKAALARLPKTP